MAETRGPAPGAGPPVGHPGGARDAPPRGRRWRESALVLLLLTALAVVLTWPAAAHLGFAVPDLGDPVFTTWILAWDVHALAATPLRLLDANMFHPHRWTLAYTEHLLGLVPLVWPARLAGAGLLLAHNLVWLATFPMAGLALFWLVRHLTGHAGAATVAAVLYAFSHFRFGPAEPRADPESPVAPAHAPRAPSCRPERRTLAGRRACGRSLRAAGLVLGIPGALRGLARAAGHAAAPRSPDHPWSPGRGAGRAPAPAVLPPVPVRPR